MKEVPLYKPPNCPEGHQSVKLTRKMKRNARKNGIDVSDMYWCPTCERLFNCWRYVA